MFNSSIDIEDDQIYHNGDTFTEDILANVISFKYSTKNGIIYYKLDNGCTLFITWMPVEQNPYYPSKYRLIHLDYQNSLDDMKNEVKPQVVSPPIPISISANLENVSCPLHSFNFLELAKY